MGWFGPSSTKDDRPVGPDGYKAPDRNERTLCWESRDLFFGCLDKHEIVDSIRQDEKAKASCSSELKAFEKDCAASWVTYFKKRRIMEHQKEQTIKRLQAEGADVTMQAPGSQGPRPR